MDSKKQYFSRTGNAKSSFSANDSNRQKASSSSDLQTTKQWPKNSRRRENPSSTVRNSYNNNNNNINNNNKLFVSTKLRPNVDKRPRPRGYSGNNGENAAYRGSNNDSITTSTGLDIDVDLPDDSHLGAVGHYNHELKNVSKTGNKRTNLCHLLNFYCTPRVQDYTNDVPRHDYVKKPKYNKEQFLQANFQFVIKATAKRKTDVSPDALIDWSLIEQINVQTPEETQCPICLYPPVAAKITRCGHVYCWPCLLHYLSLSDKTWRKCPICYESIHMSDLKSAAIMQQKSYNVGSEITFHLMRRKKGSYHIEKHTGPIVEHEKIEEKYPFLSGSDEEKCFSKFLLAKRSDVARILTKEEHELMSNVDEACPENIFIQQALVLLEQRTLEVFGESKIPTIDEITESCENSIDESSQLTVFEKNNMMKLSEKKVSTSLMEREEEKNHLENAVKEATGAIANTLTSTTKYYYFYQSDDGQNIYLHPLNVKMLQCAYGNLAMAPQNLHGRILQKECHSMDEELRRKFTCLGHLPLTCQFAVIEIELQPPYITDDVLQLFQSDIIFRKHERQRREREERERAKKINAINERQMGKLVASAANIDLNSVQEFPTCGFEEPLSSSLPDNMELPEYSIQTPNTLSSPLRRTKTLSNSSTSSCSYSAIALHCHQEQSAWTTVNATQLQKQQERDLITKKEDVDTDNDILHNTHTNLGDVLAQALSQAKEKKKTANINGSSNGNDGNSSATGSNKKSRKSKKMLPLYSTGMSFNGN